MSAAIKESKHTPGPWTYDDQGNIGTRTIDVAYTVRDGEYVTPLNVANAALIAAAPEMAQALRRLIAAGETAVFDEDDCGETSDSFNARMCDARAALARAGL